MSIDSVARDTATASVFAGYLQSLQRDPSQWGWPEHTAQYIRHRLETLAADLVRDGATLAEVA